MKPNQRDMYYAAERAASERDHAFLSLAFHPTNPLTKRDLARNIERRPSLWARYAGYMSQLPD